MRVDILRSLYKDIFLAIAVSPSLSTVASDGAMKHLIHMSGRENISVAYSKLK